MKKIKLIKVKETIPIEKPKEVKCKTRPAEGVFLLVSMGLVILALMIVANTDMKVFYNQNAKVKTAINRSVKSAALMVDLNSTGYYGENDSANGIFTIDAEAAENTFKEVLSKNLGLDEDLSPLKNSIITSPVVIREFKVMNDYMNMPYEYISEVNNKAYIIKRPCVLALVQIEIKSSLLSKEMLFGTLSSAEVMNKESESRG